MKVVGGAEDRVVRILHLASEAVDAPCVREEPHRPLGAAELEFLMRLKTVSTKFIDASTFYATPKRRAPSGLNRSPTNRCLTRSPVAAEDIEIRKLQVNQPDAGGSGLRFTRERSLVRNQPRPLSRQPIGVLSART